MEIKKIKELQSEVYSLLEQQRLVEALSRLGSLVSLTGRFEAEEQFGQLNTSYAYMLQYAAQGAADPSRSQIHAGLIEQAYRLTDRCVIDLAAPQSFELYYTRKLTLGDTTIEMAVAKLRSCLNKRRLLSSVPEPEVNKEALMNVSRQTERTEIDLFNTLWVNFPLCESDATLVRDLMTDNQVPASTKLLLVSALLLALTKFYDERKLLLLFEVYTTSADVDLQVRALTASFITIIKYPHRVKPSVKVGEIVGICSESTHFRSDLSSILNRMIRARNTENITRKMRNEFMPGLKHMSPDLLETIKKNGNVLDPTILEDNPEWQRWFEKSGISKKIEELNDLQMQGDDVFISTFSHLKSYPFFNHLANWFMPYDTSHSSITLNFSSAEKKLPEVIADNPLLCDSDKYSLMFSIGNMPQQQRDMMMRQFSEHISGLREESASQVTDNLKPRDLAVNRYVQDLYRFYHLFQRRAEYFSPFDGSMQALDLPYLGEYIEDDVNLTVVAEFYLKNGFYNDAIRVYDYLLKHSGEADSHVLQRIGLAYQSLGNYREAITYYKRYELADEHDVWNMRHLAACYRAAGKTAKAYDYYHKVNQLEPDNASTTMQEGHCLLKLDRANDALQCYFKADFLKPNSPKVWRSIAWCTFATGDYEQSANYYEKLMGSAAVEAQDHLNYGHLLLVLGKYQDAVAEYGKAIAGMKGDVAAFARSITGDRELLAQKNVDSLQLTLVTEQAIKKSKQ